MNEADLNVASLKDFVMIEKQKRDAQYEDFVRQG